MIRGNASIAGKFTKALEDLVAVRAVLRLKPGDGLGLSNCEAAIRALISGGRFYVPEASTMIEGKLIDRGLKDLMRLPFDVTCLLNKTTVGGLPTEKISIGFNLESEINMRWKLVSPEHCGPGWGVMSIVKLPEGPYGGTWFVFPSVGFCGLPADRDGYEIRGVATAEGLRHPSSELGDDVTDLMNLCVMLGLCNVEREMLTADVRVSEVRRRLGAQALPTYHVLKVDGQRWGSAAGPEETRDGVRSHLRRGHIRRLDGGARHTWVRATMVQGSRPGFVEKDYVV